MGKQRYRDKGKQGLTVKKRAGRRTFGYQVRQKWPTGFRPELR
jgi:hypothetical protein